MLRIVLAAIMAAFLLPVHAQHNHDAGHDEYADWSSRKVSNCCNRMDCGSVDDTEIKETETGPFVLILGEWCPVLREHYLTRGRSPDWGVAHMCVTKGQYFTGKTCDRLLCFTPKGGF
jgi:hypothetical protein